MKKETNLFCFVTVKNDHYFKGTFYVDKTRHSAVFSVTHW